jgi:hypothetical protein
MVLFYLYMCMVHDKSEDTHFCVNFALLQKHGYFTSSITIKMTLKSSPFV